MKKLAPFLVLLALSALNLRADNWPQNGDFSEGAAHWRGDGVTPAEVAPADPFAKPDPIMAKGLIIPLKDRDWTKISQDFRTKTSQLIFTITYIFSPGLTFSTNTDDYVNIPQKIDNGLYRPFNLGPGQWMALFTDFGNGAKGVYYRFNSKLGLTTVQGMRAKVTQLSPLEDEVVTIAFPPGKGNVILQSISLSDQ